MLQATLNDMEKLISDSNPIMKLNFLTLSEKYTNITSETIYFQVIKNKSFHEFCLRNLIMQIFVNFLIISPLLYS